MLKDKKRPAQGTQITHLFTSLSSQNNVYIIFVLGSIYSPLAKFGNTRRAKNEYVMKNLKFLPFVPIVSFGSVSLNLSCEAICESLSHFLALETPHKLTILSKVVRAVRNLCHLLTIFSRHLQNFKYFLLKKKLHTIPHFLFFNIQ